MNTKIIKIEEENLDKGLIEEAGRIIRSGGLVAFPTETVYGLGGDGLNRQSAQKIYAAKGRPSDNPLIIHISNREDLERIVERIPESAKRLADAYWPGPLTLIMKKTEIVPYETTGGLDTVAVRMPAHKTALAFIEAAGGFVAAPSANTSGRPSPTLAQYVAEDMSGKIDMIIDGGEIGIGLESTIVDCTVEPPMILRPGFVTQEMLTETLGEVASDQTMMRQDSNLRPKAPGMKYRHYAPKGELTIITGEREAVVRHINWLTEEAMRMDKKVGIIGTDENISLYKSGIIKCVGSRREEATVARHLYRILREFDDEQVDVIYSEAFEESGIGQAIMNRLLKAAGHHIEKV